MLGINTTAVIKGGKVAMLHLAKRGGGVIVNTASVAGVSSSLYFSISTPYLLNSINTHNLHFSLYILAYC